MCVTETELEAKSGTRTSGHETLLTTIVFPFSFSSTFFSSFVRFVDAAHGVQAMSSFPKIICRVRAIYPFHSDEPSSLSFDKDDYIDVLAQLDSGWWDGW